MQLENGIPIESFFDDHTDKALITLFHFLESLEKVSDVRVVLEKVFGLSAAFGMHAPPSPTGFNPMTASVYSQNISVAPA
jgi:CTD small phosphatase-like protein 2